MEIEKCKFKDNNPLPPFFKGELDLQKGYTNEKVYHHW